MKQWQKLGLKIVGVYLFLLFAPISGFDLVRISTEIVQSPIVLVQQLLVGLVNGAIVAIVALGYTLVYGILGLINFAHGDLYMLGAFMALTVLNVLKVSSNAPGWMIGGAVLLALVIAAGFCAGLNVLTERIAYRPLRHAPRLAPLISAIGVSFIFQNLGLLWGNLGAFLPEMGGNFAAPKSFPDLLPRADVLQWLGIRSSNIVFTTKDLIVLSVAVLLMIALHLFVHYTRWGKAMRATAQNPDAAKMVGIEVDQVIGLTFFVGGLLAGTAGLLVGLYNNTIVFTMGFTAGLQAFTAIVLGGIGNITGAMLGGIVIGILAAFSDQYVSSRWTNAWVFAVLILVLIVRPAGLLGDTPQDKV